VIGKEARAQMLAQSGSLPDAIISCVGGGSNAIGMFHPFIGDSSVEIIGIEAGARQGAGPERRHTCVWPSGRIAGRVLAAAAGRAWPDPGNRFPFPRASIIRAWVPSIRCCCGRDECAYEAATDDESLEALTECCRTEGILPAIESAHAFAGAKRWASLNPGKKLLIGSAAAATRTCRHCNAPCWRT
jgi:tryptophan synthase beta chain